jgi:hypothetical protein
LNNRGHHGIWISLVTGVLLLLPAYAAARAGGGEGYNGGGGGGGGHGGHGGGGGALLIDFIFFCLTHPVIGIPLLIIVVIIYFYFQSTQGPTTGNNMAPPVPGRMPHADPVGAIRSHDPGFDPGSFCNRVGAGFLKLQSSWCAQNLQDVRPFISDGIHERFSLQFAEQKAEGYRDRMDAVGIDQIQIVDAHSDEIYDELSVRIVAHAADYKVAMGDGRPIAGVAPVQPFAEVWSFLRRRGSATVPGKTGLLEGNCPNCGAPIALNESANCTNCNALLRSGQYDWVLSEITQESEWRPGGKSSARGLAALRQRDADVNIQSLEDRTSVIFWRKSAADRIGKLDPMFKVTSPDYGQSYASRLKPPPNSPRTYYGNCAVGSVDVLGFNSTGTEDRAMVEVRWSGVRFAVGPDSTVKPIEPNSPHHTLFVLMRKATAKTEIAKGISSAHCPNCGAPESGGTSGACEFCGTALNDGSNGWVLDNILAMNDPAANALLSQLNNG